jgi:hypothetical protein
MYLSVPRSSRIIIINPVCSLFLFSPSLVRVPVSFPFARRSRLRNCCPQRLSTSSHSPSLNARVRGTAVHNAPLSPSLVLSLFSYLAPSVILDDSPLSNCYS